MEWTVFCAYDYIEFVVYIEYIEYTLFCTQRIWRYRLEDVKDTRLVENVLPFIPTLSVSLTASSHCLYHQSPMRVHNQAQNHEAGESRAVRVRKAVGRWVQIGMIRPESGWVILMNQYRKISPPTVDTTRGGGGRCASCTTRDQLRSCPSMTVSGVVLVLA